MIRVIQCVTYLIITITVPLIHLTVITTNYNKDKNKIRTKVLKIIITIKV